MSLLDLFTGQNVLFTKAESLISNRDYEEALKVLDKIHFYNDFNRASYLRALCEYNIHNYDIAQWTLFMILNGPGGAGNYTEKAKKLQKEIADTVNIKYSISFPSSPFCLFCENFTLSFEGERRLNEGLSKERYYTKIQFLVQDYLLTFYWKPLRNEGGELFVYLGDDVNDLCKRIDEHIIERQVIKNNLNSLYERGKNGACEYPSMYRTFDYSRKVSDGMELGCGNVYVLGLKISEELPDNLEKFQEYIELIMNTFSDIITDLSSSDTKGTKIKILSAYFAEGVLGTIISNEVKEPVKFLVEAAGEVLKKL